MSKYIDLEKAIERLNASPAFSNFGTDGYFLLGVVEDLLNKQPTADVVEVVRCKDCIARPQNYLEPFACARNKMLVYGNSFCSFGKRREE